jgi:hypothetical protein
VAPAFARLLSIWLLIARSELSARASHRDAYLRAPPSWRTKAKHWRSVASSTLECPLFDFVLHRSLEPGRPKTIEYDDRLVIVGLVAGIEG